MARIPNSTSMNRAAPSGQRSVASAGFVADTAGAIGEGLDEQSLIRNRFQASKAKSAFLIAKAQEDSAYDEDNEFTTIEERYTEKIRTHLSDSLAHITDSRLKNEFAQELELDVIKGIGSIRDLARGKEVDYERARLDEDVTNLADLSMKASGGIDDFVEVMNERISASEESGFLSNQEATNQRQAAAQGMALRIIDMTPSTERAEKIEEMRKYIPHDVAEKLLMQAKEDAEYDTTLDNVDQLFEMFGSDGAAGDKKAYAMINKTPAKERRLARTEYDRRAKERDSLASQARAEGYEDAAKTLIAGGSLNAWKRNNRDAWDDMNASQQSALLKTQEAANNPKVPAVKTDFKTLDTFNGLWNQGHRKAATEYFYANVDKFGESHRNKLSGMVTTPEDPEANGFYSASDITKEMVRNLKDPEAKIQIMDKVVGWTDDYKKFSKDGIPPTDEEVRKKVEELIIKDDGGWLGASSYGYEDPQKKSAVIDISDGVFQEALGRPMSERDVEQYETALKLSEAAGIRVQDRQDLLELVQHLAEEGLIDGRSGGRIDRGR